MISFGFVALNLSFWIDFFFIFSYIIVRNLDYFNKTISCKETWIKQKKKWKQEITAENGSLFYEGQKPDSI